MERVLPYRKQDLKLMGCGLMLRRKDSQETMFLEEVNLVSDTTGNIVEDETMSKFEDCHYEAILSNGTRVHEKDLFENYEYADGTPFGNVIDGYRVADWTHQEHDNGLPPSDSLIVNLPTKGDFISAHVEKNIATMQFKLTQENNRKAIVKATHIVNMILKASENFQKEIETKSFFNDWANSDDAEYEDASRDNLLDRESFNEDCIAEDGYPCQEE